MPGDTFPIKGFITTAKEHMLQVHPHWHAVTEILYFMEGSALQQVNDHIFTAECGDIVIIGQDQLHSTYSNGNSQSRILVLQFTSECLPDKPGEAMKRKVDFQFDTIYQNPIRTACATGRSLLQCLEVLYGELEARQPACQYMVQAELIRLAGLLNRHGLFTVAEENPEIRENMQIMLKKTFHLVDQSFADTITLDEAAQASNLSTTHFCRLFKKATGMTFHEYLTFYRINRAELMLAPSRKLTEVAYSCGFGSVSSFIRSFKRYKGCTPSRFTMDGSTKKESGGIENATR